jgi:uncharacterized protein YozE (UPF0346 family)
MKWILTQTHRDDPIGDLAFDFSHDKTRPSDNAGLQRIKQYLQSRHACREAMDAFKEAVKEYKNDNNQTNNNRR